MNTKRIKIKKSWLTPQEAISVLQENSISTSYPTFLAWVREYNLGSKPKGRWNIDKNKLKDFIKEYFYTDMKIIFRKKGKGR